MSQELLALTYGIGSALSWGAGDFSGGIAVKKCHVLEVVFFSQIIGIMLLICTLFLFPEELGASVDFLGNVLVWSILAGWMGAIGTVALYQGLADGCMTIVAPLSAAISVLVPLIYTAYVEGLPQPAHLIAFGSALAAVWFLSTAKRFSGIDCHRLALPLVAGVSIGLFLVFIDRAGSELVIYPLIIARVASLSLFALILFVCRKSRPSGRRQWTPIILTGFLDSGGSFLFILSGQLVRLDVTAMVTSMYPAATVLLSRALLKERLRPHQWAGVGMALLAILLIGA